MAHGLIPLWPTLFGVAGILLVCREAIGVRKNPERSAVSRLFLLIAASLFAFAGFADVLARWMVVGRAW